MGNSKSAPKDATSSEQVHRLCDLKLWPKGAPQLCAHDPVEEELHEKKSPLAKTRWTRIKDPRLITYEPTHCNGIALLIVAGGGYNAIIEREAKIPAEHFAKCGFYTFELIYRLPKETGFRLAPLQDIQRAIKCIKNYGIQTKLFNLVGGMGFSAGGHLTAMAGVRNMGQVYDRQDAIDDISDRLDFMALLYPVITMQYPYNVTQAYQNLLVTGRYNRHRLDDEIKFSPHLHVNNDTPPMFIVHANDDSICPVMNSLLMYQATLDLKSPILSHLQTQSNDPNIKLKTNSMLTMYQTGGHGFEIGHPHDMTHLWPETFLQWLRLNNFLLEASSSTVTEQCSEEEKSEIDIPSQLLCDVSPLTPSVPSAVAVPSMAAAATVTVNNNVKFIPASPQRKLPI